MNKNKDQDYETIIGLEVHLQLNTETKIFCSCANIFGQQPNSLTCPVCLGLPGSLPVLNETALMHALKAALALHCTINPYIKFHRKNYYYPDLPKGYQISQYDLPIGTNGYLIIPLSHGPSKKICIHRAHIEEDAGKLIHDPQTNCSLVDYNRAGTPLMEIVTEPDLRSAQEAYEYLQILKLTLEYLNISDCDMEKGSLRCDANISIRKRGSSHLGTKTEIKNMNSFKAVKNGLEFEIARQEELAHHGQAVVQETRLWNEQEEKTMPMRSKEEAHDYRYFPEPDLVPFMLNKEAIEQIRKSLPELPVQKMERLVEKYGLSEYNARIIVQNQHLADFFEECVRDYRDPMKISHWIIGPVLKELNVRKTEIGDINLTALDLVTLIKKTDEGVLSNLAAKEALKQALEKGKSIQEIIEEKRFVQVSDDETLMKVVNEILNENQKIAKQIQEGKDNAIGFLIGQAMKKTQGKANPKKVGEIIKRRLQK